jgi:hypothetical protein
MLLSMTTLPAVAKGVRNSRALFEAKGARLAALTFICAVALVRVAATHRVFTGTLDEPVHVAAGYGWWHGEIAVDPEHPPLARILIGAPLRHFAAPASDNRLGRGIELLERGGEKYERTLARARMGNLVFLLVAILATYAWALRFGPNVALLSAAFAASMPPLLGHAGVATTDIALAAMLPLALLALDVWLTTPSWSRAALLGVAIGLAALSKYSCMLFLPVMALALLVVRRPRIRWRHLPLVFFVTIIVIWAGYRFETGTLADAYHGHVDITSQVPRLVQKPFEWFRTHVPIPAPLFFDGMALLRFHNGVGHPAYLFDEVRTGGWWYYFPVVFFFKTPLPFLILILCGAVILVRRRASLEVLAMPVALMLSVLPSAINIGVRHILPIYPLLCVVAAIGAAGLWRGKSRIAIAAIAAWMFIGVGLAHPDYLAWFNEAAGAHPERIAVDSNLDWGQDIARLARAVRKHHIETIHVFCLATVDLRAHGVPAEPLLPGKRPQGWVAVSETAVRLSPERAQYRWLEDEKPVERVGRSIRLYFVR